MDVQWITLSCDPTKPQREGCAELYLVIIKNMIAYKTYFENLYFYKD